MLSYEDALRRYGAQLLARRLGLRVEDIALPSVEVSFYFDELTQLGEYTWSGSNEYHVSVSAHLARPVRQVRSYKLPGSDDYAVEDHFPGDPVYHDEALGEDGEPLNISKLLAELFTAGSGE